MFPFVRLGDVLGGAARGGATIGLGNTKEEKT